MPCEKFEDLLTGYSELSAPERESADAHLHSCADCREFFQTLSQLDQSLTALYSGVQPVRAFNPAVVRQPSAIPELLDFCGWAAILAIVAVLSVIAANRLGYPLAFPSYAGWYVAGAVATLALLSRWTLRRL